MKKAPPPPPSIFKHTDDLRQLISPYFVQHLGKHAVIPTNEWWGNLFAWNERAESDAIFSNPYTHQVTYTSLSVSYLYHYMVKGPMNDNDAIKYYYYPPTIKNLIIGAEEFDVSSTKFKINGWDDLGVNLEWSGTCARNEQLCSMKAYLLLGEAFTTVHYCNAHVKITSNHAIVAMDEKLLRQGCSCIGKSYTVTLNNDQRWILYFYGSNCLDLLHNKTSLSTENAFTGTVQIALLPQENYEDVQSLYDNTAGAYVSGGRFCMDPNGSSSCVGLDWNVRDCVTDRQAQQFLHFALEHHKKILHGNNLCASSCLSLHSQTRGRMHAIITHDALRWHLVIPAHVDSLVERCSDFYLEKELSMQDIEKWNISKVLEEELKAEDWPNAINRDASYYFRGKALQKIGSLCLVAAKIAAVTKDVAVEQLKNCAIAQFKSFLMAISTNEACTYPIVYDTVYKGVISSEALAKSDINVDFGNAIYNDHHYHNGYYIVSAAILLYLDPQWACTPEADCLKSFTTTLVRDVATSRHDDPYFPRFRNFNLYFGNSVSHGVTPMADGKDEESVTEDMNLSYGLALYGRVTNDITLEQTGKLMMKLTAITAPEYFFISSDNTTHPPEFRKNKVSGVFFDNKCDYATWFSPNKECIHGIQMLPVIPALQAIRSKQFVREEWDAILCKLDCVKNWQQHVTSWTSLLYVNYSVVEKELSCQVLSKCSIDDGLSRAWALYVACTQIEN